LGFDSPIFSAGAWARPGARRFRPGVPCVVFRNEFNELEFRVSSDDRIEADTEGTEKADPEGTEEEWKEEPPEPSAEADRPSSEGDGEGTRDGEPTAAEQAERAAEDAEAAAEDIAGAEVALEALHDELAQARDAALRAQAEAQNARRRAEQDVEKARKFALERFAGDLLPVVDNLERATEAAAGSGNEAVQSIAAGVELTLKSLIDVLGRFNIETVDPVGEPFDPNLAQAMPLAPNPDMEPNTVMEVMQKGYTLSGRLLRPAMVVVSREPE